MAVPPVSFVIPCYRSAETLSGVLHEIYGEFPDAEVIAVVDASPDNVAEVARAYGTKHPSRKLKVIELRENRGQHYAILQGFRHVTAALVATIDDDGQNPAADIRPMCEALVNDDLDCVYGYFDVQEQSAYRRMLSRGNKWLSAFFMGNDRRIPITNVRVLRADLARALVETPSPYPFIDAMIFRSTRHIGWRPAGHRPRAAGTSGYTFGKLLSLIVSHTTIYSTLPLTIAAVGAFAVSALGFLYGGFIVIKTIAQGGAPTGWPSLMVMMSGMFALLFLFMAVLSIYVGRLYVGFNLARVPYIRSGNSPEMPSVISAEKGNAG